jgi:hypothetical protein
MGMLDCSSPTAVGIGAASVGIVTISSTIIALSASFLILHPPLLLDVCKRAAYWFRQLTLKYYMDFSNL